MGLFSSIASSFAEGWRNAQANQYDKQPASRSLRNVPHTRDLMYPSLLPRFEELAACGHDDPRAVVYSMSWLDPKSTRPFSFEELNSLDFGDKKSDKKVACQILLEKGLIRNLDQSRILAEFYTVPELKVLLRKIELPVSGSKAVLIKRLVDNGYQISARNYRHKFLELTEEGIKKIEESHSDEKRAFFQAVNALKDGDYSGAISAYRRFDNKWGFIHTPGKTHTIFAHCDIPFSQFEFIAKYPMRELRNSDEFKNTLRACLIAGLMGKECPYYASEVFHEQIQCPGVIDLYKYGHFGGGVNPAIISAMQENIELDSNYVLRYYISHIMYLSRQMRK